MNIQQEIKTLSSQKLKELADLGFKKIAELKSQLETQIRTRVLTGRGNILKAQQNLQSSIAGIKSNISTQKTNIQALALEKLKVFTPALAIPILKGFIPKDRVQPPSPLLKIVRKEISIIETRKISDETKKGFIDKLFKIIPIGLGVPGIPGTSEAKPIKELITTPSFNFLEKDLGISKDKIADTLSLSDEQIDTKFKFLTSDKRDKIKKWIVQNNRS